MKRKNKIFFWVNHTELVMYTFNRQICEWLNKIPIYKLINSFFFQLNEKFVEKTEVTKSFPVRNDNISQSVNILQYSNARK